MTDTKPTIDFKEFRRKQIAELADWHEGFEMAGVSVSDADKANGSPKTGDKIARNPKNHADKWLVAAVYFADNFEPVERIQSAEMPDCLVADAETTARIDAAAKGGIVIGEYPAHVSAEMPVEPATLAWIVGDGHPVIDDPTHSGNAHCVDQLISRNDYNALKACAKRMSKELSDAVHLNNEQSRRVFRAEAEASKWQSLAEANIKLTGITNERHERELKLKDAELSVAVHLNDEQAQRVYTAERERDALRKDALLGAALERAARDLPGDWMVIVELENGAATVRLVNPDGDSAHMDVDADNRIVAEINAAIDNAMDEGGGK
jgi:hypothetical protein